MVLYSFVAFQRTSDCIVTHSYTVKSNGSAALWGYWFAAKNEMRIKLQRKFLRTHPTFRIISCKFNSRAIAFSWHVPREWSRHAARLRKWNVWEGEKGEMSWTKI